MQSFTPEFKAKPVYNLKKMNKSSDLKLNKTRVEEPIFVIQQYYKDRNSKREKEIQFCLLQNCLNPLITKIFLLNERIYSKEELGVEDDSKIVQINIKRRLKYSDVFKTVKKEELKGFIIFCNSDIMFDATLEKLFFSNLSRRKGLIALTRYEYKPVTESFEENCKKSKMVMKGHDSQDTWIFHSSFNVKDKSQRKFDFNFGLPGCDNHIMFLFFSLGYEMFNVPHLIKTHHYHSSNVRHYDESKRIRGGYSYLHVYR